MIPEPLENVLAPVEPATKLRLGPFPGRTRHDQEFRIHCCAK